MAFIALAVTYCGPVSADETGHVLTGSAAAIRQFLSVSHAPDIDFALLDTAVLRSFYAHRNYQPAWAGNAQAENESKLAVSTLEMAEADGLDPSAYHAEAPLLRSSPTDVRVQAEHDILLTDGTLRYARDLRSGRAELRTMDQDVELPKQTFDAGVVLGQALESGNLSGFLASLAPPQPEYARLKAALAQYRRLVADGSWKELPDTMSVDVDSISASGTALRDRLAFEDPRVSSQKSDETLTDAVKRFQARHGLDADGRVGPRTLLALNIPASERVVEIEANMERWRWLPRSLEPIRIMINVPAGQLEVVADGGVALSSRVIVGRPQAPTPILRAVASSVTINPPWNVPAKIARSEILARLRRDADYLQTENMILLDGPAGDPYGLQIDWRATNTFRYHVRQLPGPKNALGQVKLELPNRFDVYLHDTPGKAAFDLTERSLSHGCVRVEQIRPLASYALSGDSSAMLAQLNDAIASGTTRHMSMDRPLPVYFLYWTAFVDADGTVEFRPDIYGRDQRLIAALGGHLAGQRVTSSEGECHRA